MDARNRTLPDWFDRVRTGQVLLPRFQRHEAWSHNEIASLLNAVLRGLPAGATLVLEVGDREPFKSRPVAGAPTPTERASEHLLDGQQRITALWRALRDNYDDRTYFVGLDDDESHEGERVWTVRGVARWYRTDANRQRRRYPAWADDAKGVHARDLLPMKLLRPGDISQEIREWADAATGDLAASRDLESQLHELRTRVATYNIPYLSLPVTTPKDVALDVFIKMNTSSVRLSAFDIVVAQLEEATGESLHDLVDGLGNRVPNAHAYRDPGVWVLDVAALREDRTPTQASYQRLDLERLSTDWDEVVDGIAWAVQVLEDENVFDADRLPTVAVLPILAALHQYIPTDPDQLGNARTLVRKFVWRAFLTSRYETTAGTRSLQDFRGLRAILAGERGDPSPPIFDDKQFPLPGVDQLLSAGWSKNKEILARGVLALSLRAGARDLADDARAARGNISKREYHHLFPDSILTGRDGGQLLPVESYRALNCALITWRTNRKISAKQPLKYLRERVDGSTLGEQVVRERLRSHLVPYDELSAAGWDGIHDPTILTQTIQADYDRFLRARAEVLLQPIADLAAGRAPVEEWLVAATR